jgi:hypothetical protein
VNPYNNARFGRRHAPKDSDDTEKKVKMSGTPAHFALFKRRMEIAVDTLLIENTANPSWATKLDLLS